MKNNLKESTNYKVTKNYRGLDITAEILDGGRISVSAQWDAERSKVVRPDPRKKLYWVEQDIDDSNYTSVLNNAIREYVKTYAADFVDANGRENYTSGGYATGDSIHEEKDDVLDDADLELPPVDTQLPPVEEQPVVEPEVAHNAYLDLLQDLLKKQWDIINACDSLMATVSVDELVSFDKEALCAILKDISDRATMEVGMTTKALSVIDPEQEELLADGKQAAEDAVNKTDKEEVKENLTEGIDIDEYITVQKQNELTKKYYSYEIARKQLVAEWEEKVKEFPYWVVSNSQSWDSDGVYPDTKAKYNSIWYAGTEQECKDKINKIYNKSLENKEMCKVEKYKENESVTVYYPHAISRSRFFIIKNPGEEKAESSVEENLKESLVRFNLTLQNKRGKEYTKQDTMLLGASNLSSIQLDDIRRYFQHYYKDKILDVEVMGKIYEDIDTVQDLLAKNEDELFPTASPFQQTIAYEVLYRIETSLEDFNGLADEDTERQVFLNSLDADQLKNLCLSVAENISNNDYIWDVISDAIYDNLEEAISDYQKELGWSDEGVEYSIGDAENEN